MKKNLYLFLVLAAVCSSCAKNLSEKISPEGENLIEKTFLASNACVSTKTALGENFNILWSTSDKIGVYASGSTSPQEFSASSVSEDGLHAEFSGLAEDASEYVALYPYDESFTLSSTAETATVTIPAVQSATEGSFDPKANVAFSRTATSELYFRNVGALLQLTLGNDGIRSVKLTANGASDVLCGTAEILIGENVPTVSSYTSGSSSVTLSGDFVKGSTYSFVVYPGTFAGGLELEVTNSDGVSVSLTNSESLEVLRNEVVSLGTLTIPADKWIQSYVLDGKAEIEAFVAAKGSEKETVNNLTIKGSDVDDAALQSIVERVGTVNGDLELNSVGTSDIWINTENFIDKITFNGGFIFRDIPASINLNAFRKDQFKTIKGDVIFSNCPNAKLGNDGWKPFCNTEKIEGSFSLDTFTGFNGESIASLVYVGGDFILKNGSSFWHLGGKTADLDYIGGDLVIENCSGFGEDSKYCFYGLHALTHIGGNVVLNGISGYMTTNETDLANQKASLCVLRDYATSGVLKPDATVYIKKGGSELAFEDLTSCDPTAYNSYILEGHDAVTRFIAAKGSKKETVKDLIVRGSDVTESDVRSLDERVGAITGTLILEGLGTSDIWISTNEVFENISIEGGITLKDIPAYVNPNGFENLTKISGDLKVINCPKLRCTGGWMPFKNVTEVTGDVLISGQSEFGSDFLSKIVTIGGDFTIEKCPSCWDWKSTTLRSIGGNLTIADCPYWNNFFGFHQLTTLGGNVTITKDEGYSLDVGGNWLMGDDWNLSGTSVGLVAFTVLQKKGIFTGTFTSYLWRSSTGGGTFGYTLSWYSAKADEIIAAESN